MIAELTIITYLLNAACYSDYKSKKFHETTQLNFFSQSFVDIDQSQVIVNVFEVIFLYIDSRLKSLAGTTTFSEKLLVICIQPLKSKTDFECSRETSSLHSTVYRYYPKKQKGHSFLI